MHIHTCLYLSHISVALCPDAQVNSLKHERIEAITDFFKHHNLPGALLARTAQYVDTMFKVHGGIDDALLEELPVHLKTEILVAAHTYVPIPAPAAAAAAVCLPP